jgi:hypothetical protein
VDTNGRVWKSRGVQFVEPAMGGQVATDMAGEIAHAGPPTAAQDAMIELPAMPEAPAMPDDHAGVHQAPEHDALDTQNVQDASDASDNTSEDAEEPAVVANQAMRCSACTNKPLGEWWHVPPAQWGQVRATMACPDMTGESALAAMLAEPANASEALKHSDAALWRAAMDDEMKSIVANHTWELVEMPADHNLVSCKWVFKVKQAADGSVACYKARLVARGFSQAHGLDYNETYAPVAKFNSIRVILALAAVHDLEVHQMDVKTAFLNGDLVEEIYMEQPPCFVEAGKEGLVCHLCKALYGLKQSPCA